MINIEENIEVKKSQEFTGNQMSIDPEFFNKMIWLVIKQYKYKIRTSLQELISNAQDAQVEAGNADKPLKITIPTKLEPTFKLRDYGTGMTPEVVNKIYCNMGASGSSHTNDKKGGFGIGGKSPLGFCDQYIIKTYVDGKYWFYTVYKNQFNGINVDLIESGNTTEENGTEIIIPATHNQVNDFKKGAIRATYFWENQPNFNLDSEEMPLKPQGIELSDKITVYNTNDLYKGLGLSTWGVSNIVILVDGIPYEVESDMIRNCEALSDAKQILSRNTTLVYKIGNGEIKVLQTRESLEECDFTLDKLNEIGLDVQKEFKKYANGLLKPTLIDTYKAYKDAVNVFNGLPSIDFSTVVKISRSGLSYLTDIKKGENFLFELVEYHHRSQRYGQTLKSSKRDNKTTDALSLDSLNKFYLDDLGDSESEQMKARRCKYLIDGHKGEMTYIKKTDMPTELYNLLVNDLGLKVLSSLPLPPKKAKTASKGSKKVLDKGKIDIHFIQKSKAWGNSNYVRNVKTIDLNKKFDNKILWFDYSSGSEYERKDYVEFFKSKGYLLGALSKKYQNKIENDDRFIQVDEYMKNLSFTTEEKEYIIQKASFAFGGFRNDDIINQELAIMVKRVSSKKVRGMIEEVLRPKKTLDIPYNLYWKLVEKFDSEIKDRNEKASKLGKYLRRKYPKFDDTFEYINRVNKTYLQRRL